MAGGDAPHPGGTEHLFGPERRRPSGLALLPRRLMRLPILFYRYTLSAFMGRQCRYLPTCSSYAEEAISRHGAWAGGWMGLSRICRCHPWGDAGFDPVPQCLPAEARWYRPWGYGFWRRRLDVPPNT